MSIFKPDDDSSDGTENEPSINGVPLADKQYWTWWHKDGELQLPDDKPEPEDGEIIALRSSTGVKIQRYGSQEAWIAGVSREVQR